MKIEIEFTASSFYIGTPDGWAIWVHRVNAGDKGGWWPQVVKERGEYLLCWLRIRSILTPPGWQPRKLATIISTPTTA